MQIYSLLKNYYLSAVLEKSFTLKNKKNHKHFKEMQISKHF